MDHTIEQVLVRMLKSPGGLSRCISICSYLDIFCGVHTQTSVQHNDMRACSCSTSQDMKAYTSLLGQPLSQGQTSTASH